MHRLGPGPGEVRRQLRQRRRHVDDRERLRGGRDRRRALGDPRREVVEDVELDPQRPLGARCDLGFQFAEFDRGEAHGVRHRLAMDEGFLERPPQEILADSLRDFDEVAEHVIVLDAQRPAARVGGVAGLERGDEAARVLPQRASLVEGGVEARPHEAAVAFE